MLFSSVLLSDNPNCMQCVYVFVCVEWSPRFLGRCWSAECVVPYGERETDYYAQSLSVCAVLGEPLQPDDDRCHELPFLWAKGESPEMGHTIVKPWKSSSSSRQGIHKINKFCVCEYCGVCFDFPRR